ncbi:MAG: hypothetical protein BWK78_03105 [Thiotrichaceae bacterium IS1]|nr:MAG: hypothetical protein BWK78_03105 [Thiotrichaceae bacterium IS1]
MEKIHESRPEPILFLLEAADAMEEYRKQHTEYAKEWHLLDITFANGPYHLGDPGTQPAVDDKDRWHPKDCDFTYWIASADKNHFLIQAVNEDNRAMYEIRSGMETPKKLP